MLIVGIILSIFGIGFFCWLLFTLAIYALPFFAGMTAGIAAYHDGSGLMGGILVGVLAGGATLALGQIAFASARTPLIRALVALVFAAPAAVAGYQVTFALFHFGIGSETLRDALAVLGAITIGSIAWARMTLYSAPLQRETLHRRRNCRSSRIGATDRERIRVCVAAGWRKPIVESLIFESDCIAP